MFSAFLISLDVATTPAVPEAVLILGAFVISVLFEGIVLKILKYETFGRSMLGSFILNLISTGVVATLILTKVAVPENDQGILILLGSLFLTEALLLSIMKGQFKIWKSWLAALVINLVSIGILLGGIYVIENHVL